ncbi:MAG TPA: MoaD/ThiS family protein [Deferrisomatales bacterium]|nr:MoaD/ThiS family protein [Deferrisomatales bacterium]
MIVRVKFFAGLREFLPAGETPHHAEFEDGATVADVFRTFGVPPGKPRIILVNGRHAGLDQVLAHNDLLAVFPPVAGG